MGEFSKNTLVYFWYKDHDGYDIYSGSIYQWMSFSGETPVAKIRAGGFSIHLPKERLFLSKAECKTDLRDKLINEILE